MDKKWGYIGAFILGAIFAGSATFSVMDNSLEQERIKIVKLEKEIQDLNDGINIPNPFPSLNKQLNAMKKQFDEEMEDEESFFGGVAKSVQAFSAGMNSGEITEREDDKYLYYDIKVGSSEKNVINVNVRDGQLMVSGNIVNEVNNGGVKSSFSSSFTKSRSLPSNVDQNNFKLEENKEDGILTIKFEKI
ncbi:putative exported protein [Halobacteriovorax marinus SJ]|uniref:Exported protein n=1 Tax=Halobacteriovorax marinus (strain ATCC BAA-682 / DSM 15412 / SJ) TaxID=862908 RepID=E1X5S4_HALMS|nr:Hsp20 family protein [Halobacteriovorax marinus]CBW25641.1 putative exported protein [Halobacteriovorax marinus SJ]